MRIDQLVIPKGTVSRLLDVLLLVDAGGTILDANAAALHCYGYTLDEITSLSIYDLRAPGNRDAIDGLMREAAARGVLFEGVHRRKDGTPFPVEILSGPVSFEGEHAVLSLVRDISERRKAEQALQASEERYRALAESSPLAIFVNRDDKVVLANPACAVLFGATSPDQLVGMSALDLFDADSRALVAERIRVDSLTVPLVEVRIVRLDGTPVDVEATASPLMDNGVKAIQVVLHDITERKQAEQELRLRALAEGSPLAIFVNSDDKVVLANAACVKLFGASSDDQLIGTPALEWFTPDSRALVAERMHVDSETVPLVEVQIVRLDGTIADVEATASPLLDRGIRAIQMVLRDITERKRAEHDLRESESRLKAMFEQAPLGIALVDASTQQIAEANPTYARIVGRSVAELRGLDWRDLTHPDDIKSDMDNTLRMTAGEIDGFHMEKRYIRPDGSTVWADMTVAPVRVGDEAHRRFISMIKDTTADREVEELLARQRARIEKTLTSVIDMASNIVEVRDPYTAGHQRRVAQLAMGIATKLGWSKEEIADITVAGLLHDVGKVTVPAEILSKPGILSSVELLLIREHALAGYQIVSAANMEEPIAELVYEHHERCNGSGYPRGLARDEILKGAKVLAVADTVEAMMSHRPYRPAPGIDAALAEIERGAGTLYDVDASAACIALFREDHFELAL